MNDITKVIIEVEYKGKVRMFGLTTPEKVAELLEDNPGIRDLIEATLSSEPSVQTQ